MTSVKTVIDALKARGSEKGRATYARHGIPAERTFGVSIADLKIFAKTIKGQQALACELYATGNMDAMYLAGLVVDGRQMTGKQLQSWADGTFGMPMIAEYTVPWAAVECPDAAKLAVAWTKSKKEDVASSGWCTYAGLVATQTDEDLDFAEIENLLGTVVDEIVGAKNRVKVAMNRFVICVGTYVQPLLAQAKEAAEKIGVVDVDMGDAACKISLASDAIGKAEGSGRVGKKRKTIRC